MGLPAWQPTWDVGRTREKLVNHEPKASDLQAFLAYVMWNLSDSLVYKKYFSSSVNPSGISNKVTMQDMMGREKNAFLTRPILPGPFLSPNLPS